MTHIASLIGGAPCAAFDAIALQTAFRRAWTTQLREACPCGLPELSVHTVDGFGLIVGVQRLPVSYFNSRFLGESIGGSLNLRGEILWARLRDCGDSVVRAFPGGLLFALVRPAECDNAARAQFFAQRAA